MKKILFCFLCIAFGTIFLSEELYASTTFFTSKDGKLFCETDSYDGSFAECDIASQKGNTLVKAVFPYPKIIETPSRQICVVSSIETDMSACQDEIDALKKALGNAPLLKNPINTGVVVSSEPVSTTASSALVVTKNEVTQLIKNTPLFTEMTLIEVQGNLYIGWNNLQALSRVCIEDMVGEKCISGMYKTRDQLLDIPVWILVIVSSTILFLSIFYFKMLFHALFHPISFRVVWVSVLILISIPGAILYYVFAYRPYTKIQLETMPPKPPSFF